VTLPWKVLVSVSLLICGLWALVQPSVDWVVEARVAARIGVVLSYPALIFALRIYSIDEVRQLWKTVRTWRGAR
jgi:hypothetical protein